MVAVSADSERRRRIGIVPVDGTGSEAEIVWAPGIAGPRDASVRWSPDGARLSVFGKALTDVPAANDPVTPSSTLFVIGTDQRVRTPMLPGQRLSSAEWVDPNRLLVLARPEGGSGSSRQDWWVMATDGAGATMLTSSLTAVPSSVQPLDDGRFVGVAQGAWVALNAGRAQMLRRPDQRRRSSGRTGGRRRTAR
jgi:dipeptidyl aminopeptidase/acylaminoacyl peptidase